MTLRHLAPFILALGFAQGAAADSTLEYRLIDNGTKHPSAKNLNVFIKTGWMLLKGAGSGGQLDLLFYSTAKQLFIIDHGKSSVMVLDENQVHRFAKQAETVKPLLQGFVGQLAKLDPQQRGKWEAMLGGLPLDKLSEAAKPLEKVRIENTSRGQKVANVACQSYNLYQGNAKTHEFCLAQAEDLKLTEGDYATVRALLGFAEQVTELTQGLSRQLGLPIPAFELSNVPGIPIEIKDLSKPRTSTLRLGRIDTAELTAEMMRVPTNYRVESFKLW